MTAQDPCAIDNDVSDNDLALKDWELQEVKTVDVILKTNIKKCLVCKIGDVIHHKRGDQKESLVVYGRNGTYLATHAEYICNNRNKYKPCRVSYYHGYYKVKGKQVFQNDVLKNDVLVTSTQTAFELDYLVELAATIEICSVNFEGMSEVYNRTHNRKLPSDLMLKRVELCRKRMTEAYFLYTYLELGQRYGISNYQVIDGNLDTTILKNQEAFQTAFRNQHFSHRCNVKGCGEVITIDGGLKPHRMLCGAKLSGLRTFEKAGVKVFTGCTRQPQPNSKYCWEHQNGDSPVIPADSVSTRTRQQLRGHRDCTRYSEEAQDDQFYVIESINEIKVQQTKQCFAVKWVGYPEVTWEEESRLPGFIKKYYTDDRSRLGSKLPNPKIKHTKKVGGSEIHLLSWEGVEGNEWLHEDYFHYLDEEGGILNSNVTVTCNTRKSRDKTSRRHTVGVFVGAFPCGTIVLFDELYDSEGIRQVYGIMVEFMARLDNIENLKEILYDDCCHFKVFSEKEKNADQNEITKYLASVGKHVDRFHFRNHVDPWCQANCNPETVTDLKGVNTQVCEQLFKKVNSHKNCKSFNEARFFFFFLYLFDIHNLSIEGLESKVADPREDFRWTAIKLSDPVLDDLQDELSTSLEKLTLQSKFSCVKCGSGFSQAGYLKIHIEMKHSDVEIVSPQCSICDKPFANSKTLAKHMKTHLKCNTCKEEFDTPEDAAIHKKSHTFCTICEKDFVFPSKLTKHVSSMHKN